LLIVGELGWPLLDDGRPSNKLARATSYSIPLVSERRFLEWIGKAVPEAVQKTYSGEQLAALSKLPSTTIQELVQFGLLDERGGRFEFRDLASARQIAKLLTLKKYHRPTGLKEALRQSAREQSENSGDEPPQDLKPSAKAPTSRRRGRTRG
jgi:hypothetical protein